MLKIGKALVFIMLSSSYSETLMYNTGKELFKNEYFVKNVTFGVTFTKPYIPIL